MSNRPTIQDLLSDTFLQDFIRGRFFRYLLFIGICLLISNFVTRLYSPPVIVSETIASQSETDDPSAEVVPVPQLESLMTQRINQITLPYKVGIIVGHRDSDSGAICEDGLTELSINTDISNRVFQQLQNNGIQTELLSEFDGRLDGYRADAVISLHVDSCNTDLSGYKTAASSAEKSPQLQQCINQSYERATSLSFNANTITHDMTNYHAFRSISAETPALILEMGFLKADRALLTNTPDKSTNGIVEGIQCYLQQIQ